PPWASRPSTGSSAPIWRSPPSTTDPSPFCWIPITCEVFAMLVKTMPVGPIGTNCYILGDETEKVCAVIDPGGDAAAILDLIRADGLALSAIFLTHGHFDHTGGVADLVKAVPGIPVYIHRADVEGASPSVFPPLPG